MYACMYACMYIYVYILYVAVTALVMGAEDKSLLYAVCIHARINNINIYI